MRKKELVAFCNIIRAVPAFFLYSIIDIETRERLKKDIARIKTVLRERELTNENQNLEVGSQKLEFRIQNLEVRNNLII